MIKVIYKIKLNLLKLLFRKKKRRFPKRKNNQVRKDNSFKKASVRSKKYVRSENYNAYIQKNYIYPSIIIFFGFLSLSLTIFLFTKQIQPFLKNERLKFLCTYQIGDKGNKRNQEAIIKLNKIVGDGDKFCKNFIFPKEKSKRGFRFITIVKNIVLKFI